MKEKRVEGGRERTERGEEARERENSVLRK